MRRRAEPVGPNADAILGVTAAAAALVQVLGCPPTGVGAVALSAPSAASAPARRRVHGALGDGPSPEFITDEFGYTWIVLAAEPTSVGPVVEGLHAVMGELINADLGSALLCAVVGFIGRGGRHFALIHDFQRGSFYPFMPDLGEDGERERDNIAELQIRSVVEDIIPIEAELTRWFALWDAPGTS